MMIPIWALPRAIAFTFRIDPRYVSCWFIGRFITPTVITPARPRDITDPALARDDTHAVDNARGWQQCAPPAHR